jgi:4-hydroxybenzoate polyprenyltransferase
MADVVAGIAVTGLTLPGIPWWLLGATVCLYAGGIVLNDFFDRNLDAIERPERPIPSGRISPSMASGIGFVLLGAGICLAATVTTAAALVAIAISACVLLYDTPWPRWPSSRSSRSVFYRRS